jgi:kynurenine formamidase
MLIDVSMPITAGSVFRRGTPPVEIASRKFYHESEREYESIVLSMSAHTATHVDLVFAENRIEPERMIGRGKLLDVTQVGEGEIQLDDVQHQACPEPCPEQGRRESRRVEIESGDFVFFRTDWSKLVGTEEYHNHPELSPEVVQWLVSKRINAVGIDALGLGRDRRHSEYDRLLIENNIFVIENLVNLSAIPRREFKVYCFPLKIENVDAIPARVVVEITEND